jgi:hypothetical protein
VAKILVQTTIVDTRDNWNVGRFSHLADELRRAGHDVTARNRDEGEDDSTLGKLDVLDYDQLGSIGRVNHFHTRNPEPDARRDDRDNPTISWPNYHSGANGDYQPVFVMEPVHELLQTAKTPSGHIEWFPAHPHEGAVSAPADDPRARVIAQGRSTVTGRRFNFAVCLDGEKTPDGRSMGRAVACSTFHHFADMNWDPDAGAPSFVTDPPGTEIRRDPSRMQIFKDYVRNIARWLQRDGDEP